MEKEINNNKYALKMFNRFVLKFDILFCDLASASIPFDTVQLTIFHSRIVRSHFVRLGCYNFIAVAGCYDI